MPITDSRSYRVQKNNIIPLTRGIDETSSKFFAQEGSLAEAINYEIVDGFLEETESLYPCGTQINRLPTGYFEAIVTAGNFTETGSVNNGDIVKYKLDTSPGEAIGSGVVGRWLTIVDTDIWLVGIDGDSPVNATFFWTDSWTYEITDSTRLASAEDAGETNFDVNGALSIISLLGAGNSNTWDAFRNKPKGLNGTTAIFQANDLIYTVRDFFTYKFIQGVEEPSIGDIIELDHAAGTNPVAHVGRVELIEGSWEAGDAVGWLHCYPGPTTALQNTVLDNWNDAGFETITNNTTSNTLGVSAGQSVPPTQNNIKGTGLLWKLDTADGLTNTGWKFVHPGFTVGFDLGEIAPRAILAPIIVTESLPFVTDTGEVDGLSPATEYPSSGDYSVWSGLDNVDSSTPGSYASTTRNNGFSRIMEINLQKTPGTDVIPGDSTILGIEIKITAHQTVGTDAFISKVQLRNDASDADEYLSEDRGDNQTLSTSTSTDYFYGNQLDLFGLKELKQSDINAGDIVLLLQIGVGNTGRTINIDEVQIKIHYIQKGQDLYFYDGTSDVATGNLYGFQVKDGDWSTDDAQGWMTFHNLDNPSAIKDGMEIRSEASGAGELIALSKLAEMNLLPSYAEVVESGEISESMEIAFLGGPEEKSAYVTTGAGPSFTVDNDDKLSFIRTPSDRDKDKPKYAAVQRNHLVLSLGEHIMISSVGAPNNFSTFDGATSWALGDEVTGLVQTSGGTLTIVCKDSIHLLSGSGATGQDAFSIKQITGRSGGKHHTAVNIGGAAVYVDNVGITNAAASDRFGDFDTGRNNEGIRRWLRPRLQSKELGGTGDTSLVLAAPVRAKNQYRLYFKDGLNLVTALADDPNAAPLYTKQDYSRIMSDVDSTDVDTSAVFVPTCISSYVTSWGEERIVMGAKDGQPQFIDPGIGGYRVANGAIRTDPLEAFIEINPLPQAGPTQAHKLTGYTLVIERPARKDMRFNTAVDYQATTPSKPNTSKVVGEDLTDPFVDAVKYDYFDVFVNEVSDAMSLRIESHIKGNYPYPLRLIAIIPHYSKKGNSSDRIQKSRGV